MTSNPAMNTDTRNQGLVGMSDGIPLFRSKHSRSVIPVLLRTVNVGDELSMKFRYTHMTVLVPSHFWKIDEHDHFLRVERKPSSICAALTVVTDDLLHWETGEVVEDHSKSKDASDRFFNLRAMLLYWCGDYPGQGEASGFSHSPMSPHACHWCHAVGKFNKTLKRQMFGKYYRCTRFTCMSFYSRYLTISYDISLSPTISHYLLRLSYDCLTISYDILGNLTICYDYLVIMSTLHRWLHPNDPRRQAHEDSPSPAAKTHAWACREAKKSDECTCDWKSKAHHPRYKSGVNYWCPLSVLSKFDMIWDFCPDMMHIIKTIFERLVVGVFSGARRPNFTEEKPEKLAKNTTKAEKREYKAAEDIYKRKKIAWELECVKADACKFDKADQNLVDDRVKNLVGYPQWIKSTLVYCLPLLPLDLAYPSIS